MSGVRSHLGGDAIPPLLREENLQRLFSPVTTRCFCLPVFLHMCVLKALYQELVTTIRTVKQSLHRKSIFFSAGFRKFGSQLQQDVDWLDVLTGCYKVSLSKHLHITGTMCTSEFVLLLHLV